MPVTIVIIGAVVAWLSLAMLVVSMCVMAAREDQRVARHVRRRAGLR
jgi:hypothetical protein